MREAFPEARVARVDRDTIRRRGAIAALLATVCRPRDRRAGRHADDREGARFSAGHAGRRDFRRRRSRPGRFSRRRADVPAAHAGGRAGPAAATCAGEAIVQTLFPESLQHSACRAGRTTPVSSAMRCRFRQAMRYPPAIALDQRRREGPDAGRRAAGRRRCSCRRCERTARPTACSAPRRRRSAGCKGEHRAQFFMKGTHRAAMRQALLEALAERPEISQAHDRRCRSDECAVGLVTSHGYSRGISHSPRTPKSNSCS